VSDWARRASSCSAPQARSVTAHGDRERVRARIAAKVGGAIVGVGVAGAVAPPPRRRPAQRQAQAQASEQAPASWRRRPHAGPPREDHRPDRHRERGRRRRAARHLRVSPPPPVSALAATATLAATPTPAATATATLAATPTPIANATSTATSAQMPRSPRWTSPRFPPRCRLRLRLPRLSTPPPERGDLHRGGSPRRRDRHGAT